MDTTLMTAAVALIAALRHRRLVCPACRRDVAEGCSAACELRALERVVDATLDERVLAVRP
jgi:hypothetical protein